MTELYVGADVLLLDDCDGAGIKGRFATVARLGDEYHDVLLKFDLRAGDNFHCGFHPEFDEFEEDRYWYVPEKLMEVISTGWENE